MRARDGITMALAVFYFVCGGSFAALADEQPFAPKADSRSEIKSQLRDLLDQRVATAQRNLEATQAASDAEVTPLSDYLRASNDLCKAERAAAKTAEQKFTALANHAERMRQSERKVEALWREGSKGGSAMELAQVQYELESARIAVLKALKKKAKAKESKE
jgi:uncharacterized protein with von Willebrand factor type A (vWA) domain